MKKNTSRKNKAKKQSSSDKYIPAIIVFFIGLIILALFPLYGRFIYNPMGLFALGAITLSISFIWMSIISGKELGSKILLSIGSVIFVVSPGVLGGSFLHFATYWCDIGACRGVPMPWVFFAAFLVSSGVQATILFSKVLRDKAINPRDWALLPAAFVIYFITMLAI